MTSTDCIWIYLFYRQLIFWILFPWQMHSAVECSSRHVPLCCTVFQPPRSSTFSCVPAAMFRSVPECWFSPSDVFLNVPQSSSSHVPQCSAVFRSVPAAVCLTILHHLWSFISRRRDPSNIRWISVFSNLIPIQLFLYSDALLGMGTHFPKGVTYCCVYISI